VSGRKVAVKGSFRDSKVFKRLYFKKINKEDLMIQSSGRTFQVNEHICTLMCGITCKIARVAVKDAKMAVILERREWQ
jgi:hypothetical protein